MSQCAGQWNTLPFTTDHIAQKLFSILLSEHEFSLVFMVLLGIFNSFQGYCL